MLKKKYKTTTLDIKNVFSKKKEENTPYIDGTKKEVSKEKKLLKIFRTNFFDLKIFLNQEGLKVGVIISGKLFKRSVDRNKIKRRIFSIFSKILKNKKENLSQIFLFYPKKEIKDIKFQDLEKEILKIF